jgi:hypothetical protein
MPLILSVDLTEIALFRNSDETSGHRDLIRLADLALDESPIPQAFFGRASASVPKGE